MEYETSDLMRKQGITCIGEMKNVLLEFSDMCLNVQYTRPHCH